MESEVGFFSLNYAFLIQLSSPRYLNKKRLLTYGCPFPTEHTQVTFCFCPPCTNTTTSSDSNGLEFHMQPQNIWIRVMQEPFAYTESNCQGAVAPCRKVISFKEKNVTFFLSFWRIKGLLLAKWKCEQNEGEILVRGTSLTGDRLISNWVTMVQTFLSQNYSCKSTSTKKKTTHLYFF